MKANERRHTCAHLHTTLLNEKRNWLPFIVVWHFPFGGSRFLPNGWKIIAIAIYKFRAHVDLMCSSSDVCVCEPLCVPSSISIGRFYQPPRTHTLAQTPTDINYIHFVPVCFKLLYFPFYECNGIQFMRQKVSIHCRVWCFLFFCVALIRNRYGKYNHKYTRIAHTAYAFSNVTKHFIFILNKKIPIALACADFFRYSADPPPSCAVATIKTLPFRLV